MVPRQCRSAAGLAERTQAARVWCGGVFLIVSGFVLWRARTLPCPVDPVLARSCTRLRRLSVALYAVSAVFVLLGAGFAFWPRY